MATATKVCKVCGREYPYCRTERKVAGVFRWQDVACCIEHGSIYLERVMASRAEKPVPDAIEKKKDEVVVHEEAAKEEPADVVVSKKSRKTSAKKAK